MLRSERSRNWLRSRFLLWEQQGHARREGRTRWYRMLVVPCKVSDAEAFEARLPARNRTSSQLELELDSHLYYSSCSFRVEHSGGFPELSAVDVVVGVVKLRGIPGVEELDPQLKLPLLVNPGPLYQGEIGVVMPP